VIESKNYLPAKADSHKPFYGWLLLFGLMMFGAFLLWWHKLWHIVFTQDQTYLSGIIVVMFLLTTLYLGRCAWKISLEQRLAEALLAGSSSETNETNSSWANDYLQLLAQSHKQVDGGQRLAESLQARLIEQVHGGHSSGWFLSDILLRLGLMGTVIGFVLMLSSVVGLQEEGISALKQLLTSMSGGMQVALLTTLTGLCSAMLVSMQCHWLDRCADQLISRIIEISAMQISPTDSDAA
jgi:biopolymer transport protein ExbB/TolQ